MSSNICQELLTAMIEQPVFSIAAQSSRVSEGPLPTQKNSPSRPGWYVHSQLQIQPPGEHSFQRLQGPLQHLFPVHYAA